MNFYNLQLLEVRAFWNIKSPLYRECVLKRWSPWPPAPGLLWKHQQGCLVGLGYYPGKCPLSLLPHLYWGSSRTQTFPLPQRLQIITIEDSSAFCTYKHFAKIRTRGVVLRLSVHGVMSLEIYLVSKGMVTWERIGNTFEVCGIQVENSQITTCHLSLGLMVQGWLTIANVQQNVPSEKKKNSSL